MKSFTEDEKGEWQSSLVLFVCIIYLYNLLQIKPEVKL